MRTTGAADMADPKQLARLMVTFTRQGRLIEAEHASSPDRALKVAMILLARQDGFELGDTLTCVADKTNARPLPAPRVKS
jgi:hypothetical protein